MASARFEDFNRRLIADFRAHGGKVTSGPFLGRDILLLTTTGAKTGAKRTSPLAYSRDGDRYVIVASKGGAPNQPRLVPQPASESPGRDRGRHGDLACDGHRGRGGR